MYVNIRVASFSCGFNAAGGSTHVITADGTLARSPYVLAAMCAACLRELSLILSYVDCHTARSSSTSAFLIDLKGDQR